MISALFVFSADSSKTAKVNPMLYPLEVRMENFIKNLADTSSFRTKRKVFGRIKKIKDVCKWKGVECNDSGEIHSIGWRSGDIGGSFDLEWFPHTITCFRCANTRISGKWDFALLPQSLTQLTLDNNTISGSICTADLPENLVRLGLDRNNFEGAVDLCALPVTIEYFDLSRNELTGALDFAKLPAGLTTLNLSHNKFSGSIDLSSLPEKLMSFSLQSNELGGDLELAFLPPQIILFDISENSFTGYIDLTLIQCLGKRSEDDDLQEYVSFDISQNEFIVEGIDEMDHVDFLEIVQKGQDPFTHGRFREPEMNVMK